MEVTCERCSTEYEFDDALVSEQGTSVRCTQCGHKFRVKKTGGAPEVWVVRTVDGRELEFRALRDLKSAIFGGRIGRDDVLSRGVGRPRRLASIAELEPFFSTTSKFSTSLGVGGPEPLRPRSRTPQGLGTPEHTPAPGNREGSVAIPLPRGESLPVSMGANSAEPATLPRPPDESLDATREVPTARSVTKTMAFPSSESIVREPRPEPTPPPPPPIVSAPPPAAPKPVSVPPDPQADGPATERTRAADALGETMPGPFSDDLFDPASEPTTVRKRLAAAGRAEVAKERTPERPASLPPAPQPISPMASTAAQVGDTAKPTSHPPTSNAPTSNAPNSNGPQPMAVSTPAPPAVAPISTKPVLAGAAAPTSSRTSDPSSGPRRDTPEPEGMGRRQSLPSLTALTPTPTEVRYSIAGDDGTPSGEPRFSDVPSRASGTGRVVAALILGGALAFGGVLLLQKFVWNSGSGKVADNTGRLDDLLAAGDKAMAIGDLDTAKEHFDKASALNDSDARVAKSLARLANVRAEIPWLKLRIIPADDGEREATRRQYTEAIERAQKAVERAAVLGQSDPEVIRMSVDLKRLTGDVGGARKLLSGLGDSASRPESALVLGALDLADDPPPWPSIVTRFGQAAQAEGDAGRARALLVYALAMSQDVERAKIEFEKLRKLPRAHPLEGVFGRFLERVAKGETPPLKVDDLPSLAPSAAVPVEGVAGANTPGTLRAAGEALRAKQYARSEQLYQSVIDREPGNSEAIAGLAAIARAQGGTKRALALYERTVTQNPNYVPGLVSLADLKWDSGDRAGAQALYQRVLQLSPNGPDADRARQRTGRDESATSSSSGTSPTPTDTAPVETPTSEPAPEPPPAP